MTKRAYFTREATGLVREFSWWDSFALGFGCIGVVTGIPVIFFSLNQTLPGADIITALFLFLPVGVICISLIYIMLAVITPRSGLEYVVYSRVLHPAIGFALSLIWVSIFLLVAATFADLTTTFFLPSFLTSLGQAQLASLLTTTYPRAIMDTFLILLGSLLTLGSLKTFAKVQTVCIFGSIVAIAIFFGLMISLSFQGFQNVYNSVAGAGAYSSLISTAQAGGYVSPPYSLQESLLAVPIVLFFVFGSYPVSMAGELKTVKKSMTMGVFVAIFSSWLILLAMAILYYGILGSDFAHAVAYLAASNPAALPSVIGSSPSLNNILFYVYGNSPLFAILNLGIALSAFILIPEPMLVAIRNIFAWSFDRVVPSKLAEVSRFKTPWVTAVLVFVATEVILLLYVFTSVIGAIFNTAVLATPPPAITGLCAALIPYKKKQWFDSAPTFVRKKIGNIPVISIVGMITCVGFLTYAFAVVLFPKIGYPVTALNAEFFAGIFLVGVVAYFIASVWRKRQGIDLRMNFTEIPPE